MEHKTKLITEILNKYGVTVRLGLITGEITTWSKWLIEPSPSYLEISSFEPISKKDLAWIEINAVEVMNVGRLIAPKEVDHSVVVSRDLRDEGIEFDSKGNAQYRVNLN